MSSVYENVVGGKLKLKGKALDVKAASGIKKKKKKDDKIKQQENNSSKNHQLNEHFHDHESNTAAEDNDLLSAGGDTEELTDPSQEEVGDASKSAGENVARWDDHLTPVERRYIEQRAKIDMHRLAKTANKSHRDRIQDFNQYLANMSEHYDIPKVGPG